MIKMFKYIVNKRCFLIVTTLVAVTVTGQDFRPDLGRHVFYPAHPLMEKQVYIREDTHEVNYKKYNATGEEIPYDAHGYKIIRSEDGLTDVVDYYSRLIHTDINTYTPDNKLMIRQIGIDLPSYLYYTYDQRERVKSETFYLKPNLQDQAEEVIYTYLDDQTIHTDSGYIHTMIRERRIWPKISEGNTDSVVIKKDTLATEYVFDEQNRLIRAGNDRYTYQKNGEIARTSTYDNEANSKYETYYDKDGLRQKSISYFLQNETWEIKEILIVSYYKDGNPSSSETIMSNDLPGAYGISGGIMLTTETQLPVRIYTLSGQLVKQVRVCPDQLIPLPQDVYIVIIENNVCKVIVK